MRNKIIIILALFLTVSLFLYGTQGKSEKKIRLTEKSFQDYFEFVIISASSENFCLDPDGKSHRIYYGWQLKKELTDEYSHINFLTPVVVTMQGHGIQTFRIEFDDEDPEAYTVIEQTGVLDDFTLSFDFHMLETKTGEKHWGFFKGGLSYGYDNGPVYYADLPEPEQLTPVTVHGIVKFFN
ncbi:MAG: hypothetical protein IJM15_01745 [Erysipelotrichaceae bacterium]|nr:hypothetical protein [Erysipelotrichaceae bacterium]